MEELQNNVAFRNNKYNPQTPDILEHTWENLTLKLNSTGGPQRNLGQWKKVFIDWKCNVRKKARLIKKSLRQTGGGDPEKPLNDLEEKLLDLTGKLVVDGIEVDELGTAIENVEEENKNNDDEQVSQRNEEILVPLLELNKVEDKVKFKHSRKIVPTPSGNGFFSKRNTRRGNLSLTESVKAVINKKNNEELILTEINESLKTLVELKKKEISLMETKIQLKYNVNVEIVENFSGQE